jgi:hypothetical protein
MASNNSEDPIHTIHFNPNLQPYQPKVIPIPPNFKSGDRQFNPKLYETYPWLEYSKVAHAGFCFYCRFFCSEKKYKVFKSEGFKCWKNGYKCLPEHHSSEHHKLAHEKCTNSRLVSKSPSNEITQLLDSQHSKKVAANRRALRWVCSSIMFCAKQG